MEIFKHCLMARPIASVFFLTATITMGVATAQAKDANTRLKVGLVLDRGGKDDRSFNASAYAGARKAERELGIELKVVEATDNNALETLHRSFARRDTDLIIGVGFAQATTVSKVAKQFPKINFMIVDAIVDAPNVRSIQFAEHEGSFLMGWIAAKKSTTNRIGFLGGMDIPLIRRFDQGYRAGAKAANTKINVVTNFIGISGEAWNNPARAKQLALTMYRGGSDVIFVAAGASGTGAFDAAEETKKFAIGVDSNQNDIKPGFILTSMLKRVDVAVFGAIEDAKLGRFTSGTKVFDLANGGIDVAFDQHNQKLFTSEDRQQIDKIRKEIIGKKIKVPDYYVLRSEKK